MNEQRHTADTINDDDLDRLYQRLAIAEAAITRAHQLADSWAVMRTHGGAAYELRAALAEPASKEQPMPTCTATIDGPHIPGDGPARCTLTVDEDGKHLDQPDTHIGPKGPDGQLLWTDHHAGATPHNGA